MFFLISVYLTPRPASVFFFFFAFFKFKIIFNEERNLLPPPPFKETNKQTNKKRNDLNYLKLFYLLVHVHVNHYNGQYPISIIRIISLFCCASVMLLLQHNHSNFHFIPFSSDKIMLKTRS